MAYHMMTSYQWHDVTDRPPTAIGETVTVIPISYACTAISSLIPHFNIVSNGWRIYSSMSEGPNRPVKVNTSEGIGCEHSERHLLAHTLWSIHKNMAFALGSWGRMAELLDRGGKLCRAGDLI